MELVIDHYIEKDGEYVLEKMVYPKFPRYQNIIDSVVNYSLFYTEGELVDMTDLPGVRIFKVKIENPPFVFSHRQIRIEYRSYMGKNKCSTCTAFRTSKEHGNYCRLRRRKLTSDFWRGCKYYEIKFDFTGKVTVT